MAATHRQVLGAEQLTGGTTGGTQWITAQLTLTIEFVPVAEAPVREPFVQDLERTGEAREIVAAPPPGRPSQKNRAPRPPVPKASRQRGAKHKAVRRSRTSKKAPPRKRR